MPEALTKDEVDLIAAIQDAIDAAEDEGAMKTASDLTAVLNTVRIGALARLGVGGPKFPSKPN